MTIKKYVKPVAIIGGVFLLYLLWRKSRSVSSGAGAALMGDSDVVDNVAPPYAIPGFTGGDFVSNIDVQVNPQLLAMLNFKMMPLFGFVGTSAVAVPYPVLVKPVYKPQQIDWSIGSGNTSHNGANSYGAGNSLH